MNVKLEQNSSVSTDSFSTSFTNSSWNSSGEAHIFSDPFEGILHRTHVSEAKFSIEFISSRFFDAFRQKIHADYMSSIDIDENNYISKCTTHIKGAKCNIKLDSHFKTMELSGIGYRLWREERFPKISQALFKRLMQELDSQEIDSSQCDKCMAEDLTEQRSLQEEQICDTITNDVDAASNFNVVSRDALNCDVAPGVAPTNEKDDMGMRNTCDPDTQTLSGVTQTARLVCNDPVLVSHSLTQPNDLFIAEKITSQSESIRNVSSRDPVPAPVTVSSTRPILTSTPIVQRQEGSLGNNEGQLSHSVSMILNRIQQLEDGIKKIKQDILNQMESKFNELKCSLVNMIENKDPDTSYAKAVRRGSPDPVTQQSTNGNSQSMSTSGLTDEGYEDQTGNGDSSTSSETQVKRPFVPLATETKQRPNGITDRRPIPVHMSNRNAPFQRRPTSLSNENEPRSKTATSSRIFSTHQERTLLIGDSIIKGINPRGLKKETKLCAQSRATIQDIYDDISLYDLKSFSNVIISVGGNDCSSRADINAFEDKYNQLINIIKTANNSCVVYVCKAIPRGDVDVSAFNHSIQRLAEQWVACQVYCIQDTFNLFFGRNRVLTRRYYSRDGIHLSHSGIKRLLDALNRNVNIVGNFDLCVYKTANLDNQRTVRPGTNGISKLQSKGGNDFKSLKERSRASNHFCYGCNMIGHSDIECWYTH